jgi:hypothetical protein
MKYRQSFSLWLVDLHIVEDISLKEIAVVGAAETVQATANTG